MPAIIELGISNAIVASGLALIALVVARRCKNPTLVHGLWALVILKLLTPPLWTLPVAEVPILEDPAAVVVNATIPSTDHAGEIQSNKADSAEVRAELTSEDGQSTLTVQTRPLAAPSSLASVYRFDNVKTFRLSRGGDWTSTYPFACVRQPLLAAPPCKAIATNAVASAGIANWASAKEFSRTLSRSLSLRTPVCHQYYSPNKSYAYLSASLSGDAQASRDTIANETGADQPSEPTTSEVVATPADAEYWLAPSGDAIEFLANSAQPTAQAYTASWETPKFDYAIVVTSDGKMLLLSAEQLEDDEQFAGALVPEQTQDQNDFAQGEMLGTFEAIPVPEWPTVWATQLSTLWRACRPALAVIWLAGSALCLLLAVVRVHRFRRVLALTRPAPDRLCASARRLCERIGLTRTPQIRLAPGVSNPLVWRGLRKSYIVLPEELLNKLSRQQAATLLTHELAHLRRKDHLMRWLELVATILYWWNPVLWIARRQLRASEERCCDAWVIWAMPQAARDYLDTVLKTVDFLSKRSAPLPLTATGMGQFQELQSRFQHVISTHQQRNQHNRLSRIAKSGLCVLVMALFPFVPTLTTQGIAQANLILTEVVPWTAELQLPRTFDIPKYVANATAGSLTRRPLTSLPSQFGQDSSRVPGALALDPGIEAVAISADDRWLAVGREDGIVHIYENAIDGNAAQEDFAKNDKTDNNTDNAGRKQVWSHRIHSGKVTDVAFSADCAWLASVGQDGRVEIRSTKSGAIVSSWQATHSWLTSVVFASDDQSLAVGGYDKQVWLYDLARLPKAGSRSRSAAAPPLVGTGQHDSAVRAIEFVANNSHVATVDSSGSLSLWDARSSSEDATQALNLLERVQAHRGVARAIAANHAGTQLATVGEDGTLKLWSNANGVLQQTVAVETRDMLTQVVFADGDRRIVTAGWDGSLHLHDPKSGMLLKSYFADDPAPVRSLAVNSHQMVVAGGQSAGLSAWALSRPATAIYLPGLNLRPANAESFATSFAWSAGTPTGVEESPNTLPNNLTSAKNLLILFLQDKSPKELVDGFVAGQSIDGKFNEADGQEQQPESESQFAPACDEPPVP